MQQAIFFFDDQAIDRTYRLSRQLNYPQKVAQNPVLTATEDWESLLCTYGSVIYDEGLFKAYYTIWWLQEEPPYACLAEGLAYAYSKDGLNWVKPNLSIVHEVNGGRNNLIRYGLFADQPCVVRLQEPCDGKQYAMAYYGDFPPLGPGIRVCFSEDGIHWDWPGALIWRTPIDAVSDKLDFYAADDTMNFYFDPTIQRYVLLRKVMQDCDVVYDPERHIHWVPDRDKLLRMIARCDSKDLVHWDNHQVILTPDRDDPPLVDFHRLSITPYAGHSIGLLEIHDGEPGRDSIAIDLVYSKDGIKWVRPCRQQQPFLPNGSADAWDSGVMFVTPQFLAHGDEMLFFYGGMQARLTAESMGKCKRYGVGLAKVRKDRFCSLRASDYETGLLITKPIALQEGIRLNAQCREGGYLQVALYDLDGEAIQGFGWEDCDPVPPDGVDIPVTWNGHQKPPKAGTYRLSVRIKAADLYTIYVASGG